MYVYKSATLFLTYNIRTYIKYCLDYVDPWISLNFVRLTLTVDQEEYVFEYDMEKNRAAGHRIKFIMFSCKKRIKFLVEYRLRKNSND